MAEILIGNIKGPQGAKGDKGDKGDTGPQGPAGPQGATGPMPALVNGFTTTEAGIAALDAAAGKTLKDEVTQLNSDLGAYYRLSGGTKIPAGSDLQNYKTPGNYYCGGNSDVLTLLNCPAQYAFNLKVEYGSGTGYPTQTLTEYFTKTKYVNSFIVEQNTWSGWISYLTNADLARGFQSAVNVPANGYADREVSHGLSGTPVSAIATLKVNTTSSSNMANVQIQVNEITSSIIKVRIHNNTSNEATVNFYWAAFL